MLGLFGSQEHLLLLGFLLAFGLAIWLAHRQFRDGLDSTFRDIPAFRSLKRTMSRSVESGQPIHLGLGVGGVSTDLAADSLAALEIVEVMAKGSSSAERKPIITLADPTLLPLAQTQVQIASGGRGIGSHVNDVRWIAPSPAAYAAGVMGTMGSETFESSVLVGSFGDEFLLLGGAGCQNRIQQVGAVSDPAVLPFVFATADELLMGEELYAAGAYLSEKPWHLASLRAQDWMRWILVLAIVGMVIANNLL